MEQVHILLRTGERKTYAFENELNRYEFLNLARNCIGGFYFFFCLIVDEIVRKSSVSLSQLFMYVTCIFTFHCIAFIVCFSVIHTILTPCIPVLSSNKQRNLP